MNTSITMKINNPKLNGTICPNCGEELYDSDPMTILTTIPAQKETHCEKCKYEGYRFI